MTAIANGYAVTTAVRTNVTDEVGGVGGTVDDCHIDTALVSHIDQVGLGGDCGRGPALPGRAATRSERFKLWTRSKCEAGSRLEGSNAKVIRYRGGPPDEVVENTHP